MNWLLYSLMTAFFFGIYGVLLHSGSMGMKDAVNGRTKAFLFVGIAYFLVAVLVPLILLKLKGAELAFPTAGWSWSLAAGVAGAIGAFGILLAFGAKGIPSAVMSIVFAGAPIVNAFVSMSLHPPEGGLRAVPWQFVVGIVLAAVGGCLVALYKPNPASPAAHAAVHLEASSSVVVLESGGPGLRSLDADLHGS